MSIPTVTRLLKEHAGAIIRWAIIALLAWAVSFGDARYAKQHQIAETEARLVARTAVLEDVPNRVSNLERWQDEQKAAQAADAAQFTALRQQLAAIDSQLAVLTALQREQAKNTDRILLKLDAIKSQ